jgi:phage-related protein
MANLQAVYYRDAAGREPAREFLDDLDDETFAALANQIDRLNLLNDEMPHLPFPHTSQIEGELRELRCHYGRDLYRVLYRRSGRLIVLLHVISKRTKAIPKADVRLATDRFADFRARMDASPRRPPRAAGHDAP